MRKWIFILFWALAFCFLIAIPTCFAESFSVGITCVILSIALSGAGFVFFRKRNEHVQSSKRNHNEHVQSSGSGKRQRVYFYDDVKIYTPPELITPQIANKLKSGAALHLKQDRKNQYDGRAVAVFWNGSKIGYLYKNGLQDMANDFINQSGTIKARFIRFDDLVDNQSAHISLKFIRG